MARNREHDTARVRELMNAGHSGRAISRETGIPETTVRSHMKSIQQARKIAVAQTTSPLNSPPPVPLGAILPPDDLIRLKALLKWWQQREERAEQPAEPTRDNVRWTVYMDRSTRKPSKPKPTPNTPASPRSSIGRSMPTSPRGPRPPHRPPYPHARHHPETWEEVRLSTTPIPQRLSYSAVLNEALRRFFAGV